MRAFSCVNIFRCNRLPNKLLSLFSKHLSAAKRDVNNLHFLRSSFDLSTSSGQYERIQRPGLAGGCWEERIGKSGRIKKLKIGSSCEHLSEFLAASKAAVLSGTWFSKEGSC